MIACLKDLWKEAEKERLARSVVPLRTRSEPDAISKHLRPRLGLVPSNTVGTRKSVTTPGDTTATPPDEFDTFDEAIDCPAFQRRLLLLGQPGSGKTTTYLTAIAHAAKKRLDDPTSPIPIPARLHTWDYRMPLAVWLKKRQVELYSDLDLSGEQLLFLLDGLDELGGPRPVDRDDPMSQTVDPRAEFVKQIDEAMHGHQVLIACRDKDYKEIGVPLSLTGAVRLLPLEADQIQAYLTLREQPRLWQTLQNDGTLLELAQTPLFLALLSEIAGLHDAALSLRKRTATGIFDAYISGRFRHEIEKRTDSIVKDPLPFDERTTRSHLQSVAATMWSSLLPDLSITTNQLDALQIPKAFREFAVDMCILRKSASDYEFIHLRFRDYCVLPIYIEAVQTSVISQGFRQHAIQALGAIGDASAVPALVDALRDSDIRSIAADALGAIGDPSAVPILADILSETDQEVQIGDMEMFSLLGSLAFIRTFQEGLRHPNRAFRQRVAGALGEIGGPLAVSALMRAVKHPDKQVCSSSAEALGKIGAPSAVSALVEVLSDTDAQVRSSAAKSLGEIGDPSAVPALAAALKDPESDVGWTAAQALANIGQPASHIFVELLNDVDDSVRSEAALHLLGIGDPSTVPALIQALQDPDETVRFHAADALSVIGKPAVHALIEAMHNTIAHARRSAALALGWLGDPSAVPALSEALRDQNLDVQDASRRALNIIRKSDTK